MPHHRRRGKNTAVLPIITLGLLALSPEQREAFAFDYDDVEAGTVTVGLFIGANRELRNMRRHRATGHLQHHVLPPSAALYPILELKIAGVGDKVGVPDATGIGFTLAAEIFRVAVEAIGKISRRIEDKIRIVKQIKND